MAVSQLARDVAAFLTSKDPAITQALSRLDFSIDAIRLDPAGYRWMGKLMLEGGIDVTGAQASGDSATAAVYTSLLDKMTLRPGLKLEGDGNSAILEQAGVVHETTHALVDFHGFAATNAVEEAAGYLAQVTYAKARSRVHFSTEPKAQAILTAAVDIVMNRRLLVKTGQKLASSDSDVKALVEAIRQHPAAYPDADEQNHSNGIFGGQLKGSYRSSKFG